MFSWKKKPSKDLSTTAIHHKGVSVSADELIALKQAGLSINLNRLKLVGRKAGVISSKFRGRGMDYQESRAYQAGDDVRHIDWRVTARSGKAHTKLFQEERERPIVLLVDFSTTMFFGTKNVLKSVVAAQVASLLAWSGAKNGDRIGGLLVNGKHKELVPRAGKSGVMALIRELVRFSQPSLFSMNENTHFNDELQRLRRIAKPGSLIVLVSDFYHTDATTKNHLLRLRQHNDIIAIQVVDPIEQQVPLAGQYAVSDGENISLLDVRGRSSRKAYQQYFDDHQQQLNMLMNTFKIPLLTVSTADEVASKLNEYFSVTKLSTESENHYASAH